jgi:predicted membrane-bound dolichyl-phosphate-mannose-protein mannosyltransferase
MSPTIGGMPHGKVPLLWRVTGVVFRSVFLIALMLITVRISLPQTLNAGTLAHFSLADFARSAIGIVVCIFVAFQLFRRPIDDQGYKAWSFIGLALAAVLGLVVALQGAFPASM